MRTLYNKLIWYITALITGLNGNNLKIWELREWFFTLKKVETGVEIVIMIIIAIIICIIACKIFDKVYDLFLVILEHQPLS